MARNVILGQEMKPCMMPPDREHATIPAARSFLRRCLCAALLLTASTGLASPLADQEQELAKRLVGDRGQQRNSRRMVLDPVLTAVARARAADMAKRHYFSHTDPDGNGPNSIARAAGYPLPSSWGRSRTGNFIESICAGQASAGAAWETWMRSRMHRTHLLAQSSFYRDQTNFGVGFYSDPSSPYRNYWVILTAPPSRNATLENARGAKAVRISVAAPACRDADSDEAPSAPRPLAMRMPNAAGKLWNWEESRRAPEPTGRLWNWDSSEEAAPGRAPRPAKSS